MRKKLALWLKKYLTLRREKKKKEVKPKPQGPSIFEKLALWLKRGFFLVWRKIKLALKLALKRLIAAILGKTDQGIEWLKVQLEPYPADRRRIGYVIFFIALVLIFYIFIYGPVLRGNKRLESQVKWHQAKIAELRGLGVKLGELKEEIAQLEEEFRILTRFIPSSEDISALLTDLDRLGDSTNLRFNFIKTEKGKIYSFYGELPIRLDMEGEYLNVEEFIKRVSQLPRLVNVFKLSLDDPKMIGERVKLKVVANLFTYVFVSQEQGK